MFKVSKKIICKPAAILYFISGLLL